MILNLEFKKSKINLPIPKFVNDCPKGIIFYGQVGTSNDWYDWFKYEGNGNINWDFFDVWESDDLPKNIKPFNDYYVDKEKLKNL